MAIWNDPGTPSRSAEPSAHSFAPTLDFLGQQSTSLPRTQTQACLQGPQKEVGLALPGLEQKKGSMFCMWAQERSQEHSMY